MDKNESFEIEDPYTEEEVVAKCESARREGFASGFFLATMFAIACMALLVWIPNILEARTQNKVCAALGAQNIGPACIRNGEYIYYVE